MNKLSLMDFFIVIFSVFGVLLIAYFSGKNQKDTKSFFLANKKVPVWIATLSFVATEISAMTIVGVPAIGFKENWQYLQFFIGSALARVFIAYFFIPSFYKYNCVTIYEFLNYRFGPSSRYMGSVFFFITRLLASGVRLYAASLAVSIMLNWPLMETIIIFSIISILFISFGGIKSVLWTGVWETLSFFLAGILVLFFVFKITNLNFFDFIRIANDNNKFSIINWGFNLNDPNILLIAILNGILGSMASFGTDQELMQRLLTLSTRKESQKSIIYTIFAALPLVTLYLAIGTAIFVFYKTHPNLLLPENSDKILSHFALNYLPNGLKGLILSAIILASIDSPLNSLSSSFVTDIYKPIYKVIEENKLLLISRFSVLFFGIILAIIAYLCKSVEGMLWLAFEINGLTAGSLLGVFLLGIFTKIKVDKINIFSMIFSFLVCLSIMILTKKNILFIGWSWFIVIGTSISLFIPLIYNFIFKKFNNNLKTI